MKEIIAASSVLPCGRSWLDNCLMELGVMWTFTGHDQPHEVIWKQQPSGKWRYIYYDRPFGFDIMYPGLMRDEGNNFDQPFRARGLHEYYGDLHRDLQCVLITRDVIEVMRSSFVRQAGGSTLTPKQFTNLVDPWTLLPMLECLGLHTYSWARHSNVMVVKQEDYRRRPHEILAEICRHYGIVVDDTRIASEVRNSDFAAMQKCESDTNVRVNGGPGVGFLVTGRVAGESKDPSDQFQTLRPEFLAKVGYASSLCGYDDVGLSGFSADVAGFLNLYKERPVYIGNMDFASLPVDAKALGFDGGLEKHFERLRELRPQLENFDEMPDKERIGLYGRSDPFSRNLALSNMAKLGL